jgi:hypothetical protein
MSNNNENSPLGNLTELLLDSESLNNFDFVDMTTLLIDMWAEPQNPIRKSLIDYVIMAAINQRDFKGLKRKQYIELVYLLVTPKIKRASIEIINDSTQNEGLENYL